LVLKGFLRILKSVVLRFLGFSVLKVMVMVKVVYIAVTGTSAHSYGVSLLPYGITQCYLPPDTSEHTPP